jgi:hypothetical protein
MPWHLESIKCVDLLKRFPARLVITKVIQCHFVLFSPAPTSSCFSGYLGIKPWGNVKSSSCLTPHMQIATNLFHLSVFCKWATPVAKPLFSSYPFISFHLLHLQPCSFLFKCLSVFCTVTSLAPKVLYNPISGPLFHTVFCRWISSGFHR